MARDEDMTELTLDDTTAAVQEAAPPGPFSPPPDTLLPVRGEDPILGRRVGPYRVDRLVARGGMGLVYAAFREDDYEQQVALKLISRESLSVRGLERFYEERQILARLQHPNVARLLDGGTTEEALPYLVMEYVEGRPIDRYCDENGLGLRRRLELFCTLCDAVQFAHGHLIVHRDLKPANVLVTEDGTVKLLDFGIAKLLDGEAVWSTSGLEPMTPTYASPEQHQGRPVTTASDVYSLGILLCKLLSGRADAARPSDLVQDKAAARRLKGDLDAIALKALDPEPEGRYASASSLAADVRRYLAHEPIEAYTGSLVYQARKLVLRNKLWTALALTILAFSVASTVLWRLAVQEKERAEMSLLRAERVSTFLQDIFKVADPNAAKGELPDLRQILDKSRERLLAGDLGEAPEIRAELLGTLGSIYNELGLLAGARKLKEEALQARRRGEPSDSHELAVELNNLGRLDYDVGAHDAAEAHFREAVAVWEGLGSADVVIGLRNLAAVAMARKRYEEALSRHQEILDRQREDLDATSPEIADTLYSLGSLQRRLGDLQTAESLMRQALDIYQATYGAEHTRVATVKSSLGRVLFLGGRPEEARVLYEQALTTHRRLLGDDHVRVAVNRRILAELLLDQGEIEAAGELLVAALDILKKAGSDASGIARTESLLGSYHAASGRFEEAEALLTSSHERLRALGGDEDERTVDAARRTAELYEIWGRKDGRSPQTRP